MFGSRLMQRNSMMHLYHSGKVQPVGFLKIEAANCTRCTMRFYAKFARLVAALICITAYSM